MSAAPLDLHQQKIVNIVKLTHENLAVARRTKNTELRRRLDEAKIAAARQLERDQEQIRLDLERELVSHEIALDDALIAAYTAGIPVMRIAQDGFGLRYPGTVQQLLGKLRADGRVGTTEPGYQNHDVDQNVVSFPKPVDVDGIINEAVTVSSTQYESLAEGLVLVEADESGEGEFRVPAVRVVMDARDPYFKTIAKNAREGTQYKHATYATLYEHPATGDLIAHESREEGDIIWDHPVARWVKDHPVEARDGFFAAISADAAR